MELIVYVVNQNWHRTFILTRLVLALLFMDLLCKLYIN